jgi:sulfhydrogenase subunit beta (sulfur reductase)
MQYCELSVVNRQFKINFIDNSINNYIQAEHTMAENIRFDSNGLQSLFSELSKRGYLLLGPRIREGGLVYDKVETVDELPRGWVSEQESATFSLHRTDSRAFFGITHSMSGWNRYLYPSSVTLYKTHRDNQRFSVEEVEDQSGKVALIGVRPCDLEAIKKYDRIFKNSDFPDKTYSERRTHAFIVTVNCTQPSGTCFCASMGTGPKADSGFDLALTEIWKESEHYFIAKIGSDTAREIIEKIPHKRAENSDITHAHELLRNAATQMGRSLETENLKEILYLNYEHSHWDEVAERCFTCGNCTMVCPTCFCTTIEDYTDLSGNIGARIRKWDSCYNNEFSYIHGGSVRTSSYARYRHWLMHKLATYQDQFNTPGCVGCGRCITWCPAGIDITEEATAIRKHGKTL